MRESSEILSTATATVFLAEPGFVRVNIHVQAKQTLEDAKVNLAAAIQACASKKRPLMTDIREAQPLEPEARRYYSGQVLVDHFSALALLVDVSPFGRTMANIYLRVAKPAIPTQMFTEEASAIAWLTEFTK